jgi:glycosyltransferase involved in cell wall biosynthesis
VLTFSIVTPSLNQGEYIERTIRSVLDQGYPSVEYIVCDGGSTDHTPSVLQRFADRIRAIAEPDAGQAAAVNKGIQLTSGEVIGWLNSDDLYRPGALHCAAEFLLEHPEVDLMYGDADLIDGQDRPLGRYATEPWHPDRLPRRPFLCQPAVFFRRRVVERFGPLDDALRYCMDYEYWLRLAAGGARVAYLPVVLAASRIHADAKSQRERLAIHAELNTMLKRRLGSVPESWLVNHAYTLTELSRQAGHAPPMPFVVQAVLRSMVLAWRWNGSMSRELLADGASRLVSSARKGLAASRGRR